MADYDGDLALRREQNIERNNKYLQELGLLPKTKTSEKAIKAITTNIWAEDESVTPNKITRLLHRESITDFIFHYYKSVNIGFTFSHVYQLTYFTILTPRVVVIE